MDKKAKVFQNIIDKEINNNRKYSVTKDSVVLENHSVLEKINSIFNDKNYIYKADVTITLKDKIINRKIIGKKGDNLVTIDNELISIKDIIDINKEN